MDEQQLIAGQFNGAGQRAFTPVELAWATGPSANLWGWRSKRNRTMLASHRRGIGRGLQA
jgi:hypothetical protein